MKDKKIETVKTFRDENAGVEVIVTMQPEIKNPCNRYMIRPRTIIAPKGRQSFTVPGYQPDLFQPSYGKVEFRQHRGTALINLIAQAEEFVVQEVTAHVDAETEERRIKDEKHAGYGKPKTRQTGKTARNRERRAS